MNSTEIGEWFSTGTTLQIGANLFGPGFQPTPTSSRSTTPSACWASNHALRVGAGLSLHLDLPPPGPIRGRLDDLPHRQPDACLPTTTTATATATPTSTTTSSVSSFRTTGGRTRSSPSAWVCATTSRPTPPTRTSSTRWSATGGSTPTTSSRGSASAGTPTVRDGR